MRILVLSVNYWPEDTGIGPIITWRCEFLAARGHEVTVCTTFPYYPQWRVTQSYRGRLWEREVRNRVAILRSWAWIPRRVSSLKRMLFEASFLPGNLVRAMSAGKPDLLLIESPPLGLAATAGWLSRWWKVPYIYDVMDLQPDAAAELDMLQPGTMLRKLYRLERLAYERAALVSTLTEGIRRRIVAKSVPAEKVTLFPPRADRALFAISRGDGCDFRRAHGLADKFIVAHSGNMGVKQGLEVIVEAARLSRDWPEIVYLLVGDGARRAALEARVAAYGLPNVRFLPVLPQEQFRQMLAAVDIGLITQQRSVSDIVFPSKTATLLAAGCPVIASVSAGSEVAQTVEDSGGGRLVAPENSAALFAAILSLRNDTPGLAAMSAAGRRYAREHWDENHILPFMESELLRVAGKLLPARKPALAAVAALSSRQRSVRSG